MNRIAANNGTAGFHCKLGRSEKLDCSHATMRFIQDKVLLCKDPLPTTLSEVHCYNTVAALRSDSLRWVAHTVEWPTCLLRGTWIGRFLEQPNEGPVRRAHPTTLCPEMRNIRAHPPAYAERRSSENVHPICHTTTLQSALPQPSRPFPNPSCASFSRLSSRPHILCCPCQKVAVTYITKL